MTRLVRDVGIWLVLTTGLCASPSPAWAAEWTYEGGSQAPIANVEYQWYRSIEPGFMSISERLQNRSWLVPLHADATVHGEPIQLPGYDARAVRLSDGDLVAATVDSVTGSTLLTRVRPDGRPVWLIPLVGKRESVVSTPIKLDNDDVLVTISYDQSQSPGANPSLMRISGQGRVLWQMRPSNLVLGGIQVDGDRALLRSIDGSNVDIACLDLADGHLLWHQPSEGFYVMQGDALRRVGDDFEVKLASNGDGAFQVRRLRMVDGVETLRRNINGVAPGVLIGANRMVSRVQLSAQLSRLMWVDTDTGSTIWSREIAGSELVMAPVGASRLMVRAFHGAPGADDTITVSVLSMSDGGTLWESSWNVDSPYQAQEPFFIVDGANIYVVRFVYDTVTRLSKPELTLLDSDGAALGTSVLHGSTDNSFMAATQRSGPIHLARAHAGAGPTPRSVLTALDEESGEVRFETQVAQGELIPAVVADLEVGQSEIAVITTFGSRPPYQEPHPSTRSSALTSMDIATGARLWSYEFPREFAPADNFTFQEYEEIASDPMGGLYASTWRLQRVFSSAIGESQIRSFAFRDGTYRWEVPLYAGVTGGTLFGAPRGVMQPPTTMLAAPTGAPLWSAGLGSLFADRLIARQGDVFLADRTPFVGPDRVEIRRLDGSTGAVQWMASLVLNSGSLLTPGRLQEAANGDLLVRLINVEDVNTRRLILARLNGDTGTVKWISNIPSVALRKVVSQGIQETADGSIYALMMDYAEDSYVGDLATASWSLYRLNGETGEIGPAHVIAAQAAYDFLDHVKTLALNRMTDPGELIVVERHVPFGGASQPRVRRRVIESGLSGDLRVGMTLSQVPAGAASRADFRIDVNYDGNGVLDDAILRTEFPGVVIEGVSCTTNLGECGELARVGDLNQHLRLPPGAHAIVTGSVVVTDPQAVYGTNDFRVFVQGPIGLAESDVLNNRAPQGVRIDAPIHRNGFE